MNVREPVSGLQLHCLAYGVTSTHVLAIEVVLPDGRVTVLGGLEPEPPGYDLRGTFVGGEGTLGVATKIAVRLTPIPPVVRTLLLDFTTVDAGAETVYVIIAGGLVPAAIELWTPASPPQSRRSCMRAFR